MDEELLQRYNERWSYFLFSRRVMSHQAEYINRQFVTREQDSHHRVLKLHDVRHGTARRGTGHSSFSFSWWPFFFFLCWAPPPARHSCADIRLLCARWPSITGARTSSTPSSPRYRRRGHGMTSAACAPWPPSPVPLGLVACAPSSLA